MKKKESVNNKKGSPATSAAVSAPKAAAETAKLKKAANHASRDPGRKATRPVPEGSHGDGQRTAFHHMQRASVIISLMEKGTGQDLRDLLKRGVKLYEHAMEGKDGDETILKAIGVLRAAEHLALAGLYEARHKHRQKVKAPPDSWLKSFLGETRDRLARLDNSPRGKGPNLFPVTEELILQAQEAHHDPHLSFELAMAADALCFALENGL